MDKKILWINSSADFTGGCESYIYHTAVYLRELGFHNTLLYDVEGWTEPRFLKGFEESYPRVELLRQIKEIAPDIIYVHRLSGIEAMTELLQCGIPVVRFYHDHKLFCLREHKYRTIGHATCRKASGLRCYPCLGFINRSNSWTKIRFSSLMKLQKEQSLNRKLHGHIVASEYMREHLILHGFRADKIRTFPLYSWNGRKDYQVVKQGSYFLFAGQLLRGKGLDIALRAMPSLPQSLELYVAGRGKQETEFKALCRKLKIENRVKFLGFMEQEKMEKLYSESLCLLMPSRVPETFGLSGLEAMSRSKPVIASNVGGIGEWLKDGENGIMLNSLTAEDLTRAMLTLYKNPVLAEQMGRNGQEKYLKRFQPANHITPLAGYFTEIISGGKHV